jgi:mannose/fructose/N-acetylgalactosamine-specific phosphotransferase system component IID
MTQLLTTLSVSHAIQGIIVGAVLAFLTANLVMNVVMRSVATTVNGWSSTSKCGQPGNGILLRAACAKILPAVNVAQEAAYWTTKVDGAGVH